MQEPHSDDHRSAEQVASYERHLEEVSESFKDIPFSDGAAAHG